MKSRTNLNLLLIVIACFLQANFCFADRRSDVRKLLNKRNILALPSALSQVANKLRTSRAAQPPPLKSISDSPIKNLFWRDIGGINVVDAINAGNFSLPYCAEFFAGSAKGESGGLGACYLASSVGAAFRAIAQNTLTLCYMKKFPTAANFQAGGITVNKGQLPEGNIEELFSIPKGTEARIVKVTLNNIEATDGVSSKVTSQDVYLQIFSAVRNKRNNELYSAYAWNCDENNSQVTYYERISVNESLRYLIDQGEKIIADNPTTTTVVSTGVLARVGNELIWDPAEERISRTASSDGIGNSFKNTISITSENLIRLKHVENNNGANTRGFIITKYSGQSPENLRFLSGAFNEFQNGSRVARATVYNGSYYQISPANRILDEVLKAKFRSGYFASDVLVDFNPGNLTCNPQADIEITLDFNNESLLSSLSACLQPVEGLANVAFCDTDSEVVNAFQEANNGCF